MTLPVITDETIARVMSEMASRSFEQIVERLRNENPQLESAVNSLVAIGNYCYARSVVMGAMMAYRLLEIQAESGEQDKDQKGD